jgi:hypothetical protein
MRPINQKPTRNSNFGFRVEQTVNDLGWGCQVDASSPQYETEATALGGTKKSKVAARLNQVRHPAAIVKVDAGAQRAYP